MCGGLRGVGLEGSGLQAPDQIHRCLFMVDSDRWGSEQIPQWRETAPDPQCPMERRRGGQPAKDKRQETERRIMSPR